MLDKKVLMRDQALAPQYTRFPRNSLTKLLVLLNKIRFDRKKKEILLNVFFSLIFKPKAIEKEIDHKQLAFPSLSLSLLFPPSPPLHLSLFLSLPFLLSPPSPLFSSLLAFLPSLVLSSSSSSSNSISKFEFRGKQTQYQLNLVSTFTQESKKESLYSRQERGRSYYMKTVDKGKHETGRDYWIEKRD